uniref:Uncharacterized protein n=1 Tax=Hemiselmis andersenii TaxID=464988 RepID=A0A7S0UCQ0_HEMAN|mmetsp:Transcript_5290/g.12394  ORF Transcript_5290/g.12394 Transcript_5290/m.12394 type:complete len:121 (+) Transcript_5290:1-363(+)
MDGPQAVVAHAATGSVLVSSYHRNRILVLDAETGKKLREFGGDELKRPVGMAVAPFGGEVLVSSHVTNEVLRYNASSGTHTGYFARGFGLWAPTGVAVGGDLSVWVATFADGVRRYGFWK